MASIIIIEDDEVVRRLCAMVLHRAGHSVLEAGNADEAEHIWREHRVDLAVVDLVLLGGKSGADCALQLMQENPYVKILFISGWLLDRREADADNMGQIPEKSHQMLAKPFAPEQLVEKVRELLRQTLTGTA